MRTFQNSGIYLLVILMLGQCSLFSPDEEVNKDVLIVYDVLNNSSNRYDYDIWITNFDGNEDRLLISENSNDISPRFNTDGSGFYYLSGTSTRDLFFADTAGNVLTQLTSGMWINSFDLSPTGDKLVFADDVNDDPQVYIINPDGQEQSLLSRGWNPIFTSDGDAVIFLNSAGSRNLRKVTIGSSDTLEITSSAPASTIECVSYDRNSFIVFTRPEGSPSYMYHTMTENGEFIPLNFSTNPFGNMALSSDGQEVGFAAYSENTSGIEVYLGNARVTSIRQLTKEGLLARNIGFFPSDDFLVYTQENGTDYSLNHVDAKGQSETRISHIMASIPLSYDVYEY